MTIAVLLPTRGLIFAETIKSIISNLREKDELLQPIIGVPIPESHNKAVRMALATPHDAFWFVEEDVAFPQNTLEKMLEVDADIVAVNYPVDSGHGTVQRKNGEIIFCGVGCTLIRKKVFETLKDPWFDTSKSLRITSFNPYGYVVEDIPYKYGGLDVYFCHKAREAGFQIGIVEGIEATHLRVVKSDDRKYNNGVQEIVSLPPISKHINYN